MLRLSTRYLHEQLDLVEAQHAHDPGWVSHAAAGHMRYWLNEPDAAALLHQAAQQYHGQAHHHAEELLHIGYLYYLAADDESAQAVWRQAYERLQAQMHARSAPDLADIGPLIASCTLLGEDAQAEGLFQAITNLNQTRYPPPPVYRLAARLSRARRTRDVATATACVEQCEHWIKRSHDRIGLPGIIAPGAYLWHWYDYALRVVATLDPAQATALVPVHVPGVLLPPRTPESTPLEVALQRLEAYAVTHAEWTYYVWQTHDHVTFQHLTFADGTVLPITAVADLELLEALWDCIELPLTAGWTGMHRACGIYRLDVAQRRIRQLAEVVQRYAWSGAAEPTSLEEMDVRPLAEDAQLVVDVLDV
jgi:hypothetical protein